MLGFTAVALLVFGLRANGNTAAELVTNDALVWLANPPKGTVVQVHGRSRDVTETVKVGGASAQLVSRQLGTGAIVLDQGSASIGRVDGAQLDYQDRRALGSPGADLALAVGADQPFVIDTAAGTIEALDASTLLPIAQTSINRQQPPSAVVGADGQLWAYDRQAGSVLGLRPSGSTVRTKVTDPGTPGALALADNRPVLVEPTKSTIRRLDSSGKPGASSCLTGDASENVLVTGSGPGARTPSVFTVFPDSGDLSTSNLQNGTCVRLQLGDDSTGDDVYGQPVAIADVLFVPLLNRGRVFVVDGDTNTIERTISNLVEPNHRFELFVDDGTVWFNDLEGGAAGIIDRGGIVFTVDKNKSAGRVSGNGNGEGPTLGNDPNGSPTDNDPNKGETRPDANGTPTKGDGTANGAGSGSGNGAGNGTGKGTGGTNSGGGTGSGAGSGTGRSGPAVPAALNADGTSRTSDTDPNGGLPAPALIGGAPNLSPAPAASPSLLPAPSPSPSGPSAAPGQNSNTPPVVPPPETLVANFSWSPPGQPNVNTTLDFVDTSLGKVTNWVWSFTGPDGSSSTAQGARVSRTLPLAGNWSITLTVTNGTRVDTTRPAFIAVSAVDVPTAPVANFTWDPQVPVVDTPVQFRDASSGSGVAGSVVAWAWDFGDGTTSTEKNPPAKTYANAGSYIVRLVVRNQGKLEAKVEARLTVATRPDQLRPDFAYSPPTPRVGDTVEFRDTSAGGPTSWAWDLGDGTTARTQFVAIRYRDQGDFKVTLTVRNEKGTESIAKTVRIAPVNTPPLARISQPTGSTSIEVNKPLRFVSGTTGVATKLVWDFGDDSKAEGSSVEKTWARAGRYKVTLTASNDVGATTATLDLDVTASTTPAPISASFRVSPGATITDPATVGDPVLFTNTSTGQGTFLWDFGDGTQSTQSQPTHAYASAGRFTATLKMTNGDRTSTATPQDVFVRERVRKPKAAFTFAPSSPATGQTITFTDTSENFPDTQSWDFGDGTTGSGRTPTKIYANPGTYFVVLTAKNSAGEDSFRSAVQVTVPRTPPVAIFEILQTPTERLVGAALTFTDRTDATRPLTTPVFTFPDRTLSPAAGQRSVQYQFVAAGTFPVSMKVCWADQSLNCAETTQSVTILQATTQPTASFVVSGPAVIDQSTISAVRSVTFTDTSTGANITRREWNIGGSKYDTSSVTLTLPSPGQLSVTLAVTNVGGTGSASRTISVVALPNATFEAPTTGLTGGPVTFTDTSTGFITSWTWDFGDGSTFTTVDGTRRSPQHTYLTSGSYTVRLRVANAVEQSTATPKVITINAPALPTPVIQAVDAATGATSTNGAITVRVGDDVQFTDTSNGPTAISWVWQWGDSTPNTSTTVPTALHVFGAVGTYTVRLVATNAGGSKEVTLTVTVTPAPAPAPTTTTTRP